MKSLKVFTLAVALHLSCSVFALSSFTTAFSSGAQMLATYAKKAAVPLVLGAVEWSKEPSSEPREYFRFYAPDEISELGSHMKSFNAVQTVTLGLCAGAVYGGFAGYLALPALYGLLTGQTIKDRGYYFFGGLMQPVSVVLAASGAVAGGFAGSVSLPIATLLVRGYGSVV